MASPHIEIPKRGQRAEEPLGDASILKPRSSVSSAINPDGGDSDVSRLPSPAAPQMETSPLQELINGRDKDVNTPLHLAKLQCHEGVERLLTEDKSENFGLTNNQGSTEPDFAESRLGKPPSQSERRTELAHRGARAPRTDVNVPPVTRNQGPSQDKPSFTDEKDRKELKNLKDVLRTYLVVATLVATVTFTAGLTVPGGYKTSEPNEGMATLLRYKAFQAFIFCDTLAFYCSIISMALLIRGQKSIVDIPKFKNALRQAIFLLVIALVTMPIAFLSATYLVVSIQKGLSKAILVLGVLYVISISVYVLVALLAHLFFTAEHEDTWATDVD